MHVSARIQNHLQVNLQSGLFVQLLVLLKLFVCTIVGAFKVVCMYNNWCFESCLYVQMLVLSKWFVCTIIGALKVVCMYNCWCFQSGLYVQ